MFSAVWLFFYDATAQFWVKLPLMIQIETKEAFWLPVINSANIIQPIFLSLYFSHSLVCGSHTEHKKKVVLTIEWEEEKKFF